MSQPMRIVVLGTGGTIAGRASPASPPGGYQAGQLPLAFLFEQLFQRLPQPPGLELEFEQLAQIDSKDVTEADWRAWLAAVQRHLSRAEVRAVLVTHGTDTLEESAFLLQALLNPAKPVLLVGAMRAADAIDSDGPKNLADALLLAATPGARGVLVPCVGQVFAGHELRKWHPQRLDALGAAPGGALAEVRNGRLRRWRDWPDGIDWPNFSACRAAVLAQALRPEPWPRVEVLTSHGGHSGALVRALLRPSAADPAVRGLVVAGCGNASVHATLLAALEPALQAGLPVWCCSRCGHGQAQGALEPELELELVPPDERGGALWRISPWPAAQTRLALQLHLLAQDAHA